jgi:hypothetical protein
MLESRNFRRQDGREAAGTVPGRFSEAVSEILALPPPRVELNSEDHDQVFAVAFRIWPLKPARIEVPLCPSGSCIEGWQSEAKSAEACAG